MFRAANARFRRAVSRSVRWQMLLVAAALLGVLLVQPRRLIGESEQADAARQQQAAKIESWLGSQDAAIDRALAAELARGIIAESERHGLDPALVLAVIQVESRFDPRAVSPRGAQGLMQVKPVVVAALIDEGRIDPLQRHRSLKDPLRNVQIGASYLALLNEMFGDVKVALIAYNSGPARVREKLRSNERLPMAYATKVLSVQRTLQQQLALRSPPFFEIDSATVSAAG
jgi:soluble lytic murein transglycosylase